MKRQQGFTLIELIAVIVILGILAATAVPRFANLQTAARAGAVAGIAGSIESASAINYATELAEEAGVAGAGSISVPVAACDIGIVNGLLDPGSQLVPANYTITTVTAMTVDQGALPAAADVGDYAICNIADATNAAAAADFTMYFSDGNDTGPL